MLVNLFGMKLKYGIVLLAFSCLFACNNNQGQNSTEILELGSANELEEKLPSEIGSYTQIKTEQETNGDKSKDKAEKFYKNELGKQISVHLKDYGLPANEYYGLYVAETEYWGTKSNYTSDSTSKIIKLPSINNVSACMFIPNSKYGNISISVGVIDRYVLEIRSYAMNDSSDLVNCYNKFDFTKLLSK